MNDDIKYIGNFTNDEIESRSSIKSSKEKKNKEFKINKTNLKVKQFISSTKTKIINKKVMIILIIIAIIYIAKPISFLKATLDTKREYYMQLNDKKDSFSISVDTGSIIDSITYASGAQYYKNCKDTMVYPADGLITTCYDLAHKGIDIACDEYPGNVYAAANGRVVDISNNKKYGDGILIEHSINRMTIYTYYANLSAINVYNGQYVYQNEIIGLEGGDPNRKAGVMDTKGHHLHFEVRKSEKENSGLNPLIFIQQ